MTPGPGGPPSVGRPGPRWEAGELAPPYVLPADRRDALPQPVEAAGDAASVLPPYASITRRSAAWIIDEAARTLFYTVLLMVIVMLGGQIPDPVTPGNASLTAILPQVVMRVGLSWIFWSQGTSPGAVVMRVRLVDAAGNPPGATRGLIRGLVEVLSISTLLLGFFWALFTRRRQTWHDLAAGVYVVDAREERDRAPR